MNIVKAKLFTFYRNNILSAYIMKEFKKPIWYKNKAFNKTNRQSSLKQLKDIDTIWNIVIQEFMHLQVY